MTDTTALPGCTPIAGLRMTVAECQAASFLPLDGSLDLTGCAALTVLPAGLFVRGRLDLTKCAALTTLPAGLTVEEERS